MLGQRLEDDVQFESYAAQLDGISHVSSGVCALVTVTFEVCRRVEGDAIGRCLHLAFGVTFAARHVALSSCYQLALAHVSATAGSHAGDLPAEAQP